MGFVKISVFLDPLNNADEIITPCTIGLTLVEPGADPGEGDWAIAPPTSLKKKFLLYFTIWCCTTG